MRKVLLSAGLVLLLSSCMPNLTATIGVQGKVSSQTVSKNDCKNGGWQNLSTSAGTSFKNQGDCVSYFAN